MKVTIAGPNLMDQSKGQFHVHKDGCRDLTQGRQANQYGYRFAEPHMQVEADTRQDVVTFVYSDIMAENEDDLAEWEAYEDEFHFAPCVNGLKRS